MAPDTATDQPATDAGPDTQPHAAVTDDASSSDDSTGGGDPLTDRLAACIDRYVWTRRGPHDAAIRILADPVVRDAFHAADVVRALGDQHQSRRWADGSSTVVCTAGCGAFPCATRALLDGGLT